MAAARVFISYRRQIAGGHAGRVYDTLAQRVGRRGVFFDESTIAPGADFPARLRAELSTCSAMVVVIGPNWAQATDDAGLRRLHAPGDWVRVEVEAALAGAMPIVPALVGRAEMPSAAELPDSLARLAALQAVELREATWDSDVERLRAALGLPVARPWLARLGALAVGVAVVAVAIGLAVDPPDKPASDGAATTPADPTAIRLNHLKPDQATQEALVNRFFGQGINVPLLRRFLQRPDLAPLDPNALDAALVRHVRGAQRLLGANLYDNTDQTGPDGLPGPACSEGIRKVKAAEFESALAGWDETIGRITKLRKPSSGQLLYGAWCQWLAAQVEHLDGRASAGDERLARAIELAQRAGAGNGLSLMHYQRTAADWAREHGDLEAAAKATAGVAAAARSRNGHDDPDLFVELAQLHAQMGRPEQSLAWRQQAQALYDTRLDPGNAKQRANASALAALYQRSGQPEAAARLRQRYGL